MADTPLSHPTSDKIPAPRASSRQAESVIDKRPFIAADVAFVAAAIAIAFSGGGPLNTMQFFWVSVCVIAGGVLLVLPWLFELRLRAEMRNTERDQLNWETMQQLSSAIQTQQTQATEFREQAEKCTETIEQQDRENKELSEQITDIKAQLDQLEPLNKQIESLKSAVDPLKPALDEISKALEENAEKLTSLENHTPSSPPELEALSKNFETLQNSVSELKETLDALSEKTDSEPTPPLKEQLDSALEPLKEEIAKLTAAKPPTQAPESAKDAPKAPEPITAPLKKEATPTPNLSEKPTTPTVNKDAEKEPKQAPQPTPKLPEPAPQKEPFSPRQPETRPSMMEKAMGGVRAGEQSPAISRLITPPKPAPENKPAENASPVTPPKATENKPATPAPEPEKPEAPAEAEPKTSPSKPEPDAESKSEPKPIQPQTSTPEDRIPQLNLDNDDSSAPALLKAVSASAKSKPPVTDKDAVLILNALVGIGNKPYLRAQGSDQGQVMEFVEIGKWRYIVPNVDEQTEYELFLNDEKASDAGSFKLTPGDTKEITARF